MRKILALCLFLLVFSPIWARATVFGALRGIVHDPQHRPISGATVTLKAAHSDLTLSAVSNQSGEFTIPAVPLGDYTIAISKTGFAALQQTVTVSSDSSLTLHYMLPIAPVNQTVSVYAIQDAANVDSVTPQTQIDRIDIARTPGADRTNSLAMITDFVPGAYVTHDMLHMRGGHQVSWLMDGVQIPNTNIASNIGPQIDPKDIDTLEVDRGSYNASLGDRTYGIFDVVPRTGFERNRDAELVLSLGNFWQTNDQLSLGDHTERFAWYGSMNYNYSNVGLQPATPEPVHDMANGYGGFGSLVFNHDPANQLRYVGQLRTDYYQIPYDPNPDDWENQLYDSSGLRDGEHETDSYGALTWLHTFSANTVAQVSPFYHYNRTNYQPSPDDQPNATTADQTGMYTGGQASFSTLIARNTLRAGIYGYAQHENDLFGVVFNDGSASNFSVNPVVNAGVEETYIEDNFRPTDWLTLIGGIRQSHFSGAISENAVSPRIGIALQVPKLNWVFRAFYGHYYQPPPLTSITGPALEYAQTSNDSFVPLRGERDEEHQFGVQIPFKGWLLDADTFQTEATKLPRSQQHRRVQRLHPHHRAGCTHSGMGAHHTLAPPMAVRAGSPLLLQPDRATDRRHHRRPHLLRPLGLRRLRRRTRLLAARPRSAQHAQRRHEREPAIPSLRSLQRLLRLRLLQRLHRPALALHRRLPSLAHHRRSLARPQLRRTMHSLGQCTQRRQHARAARQQPDLRWLSLQRAAPALRRTSLSVSSSDRRAACYTLTGPRPRN